MDAPWSPDSGDEDAKKAGDNHIVECGKRR